MATDPNDAAFLQKYGNYKPAPANVPVTTIKPIIGGESPEEAAARRAEEDRKAAEDIRKAEAAERERIRFEQEQKAGGGAKPTEAQQKTLTLLTRIAGGAKDIQNTLKIDPEAQQGGFFETLSRDILGEGMITRSIAGPDRRIITDAQANMLDAILTLGTGAAYNEEQKVANAVSYFPQYGDTQREIDIKNQRLNQAIEAARIQAGPLAEKFDEAIKPLFGAPPAPPAQAAQGEEAGPVVTVTREQSIAAWGQPFTDENGNFVGSNFTGVAYDATGKPRIIGSVSDTNLDQPAPSFYESVVGSVTGEDRSTPATEALPDWTQLPELTQLSNLVDPAAWQTAFATALGGSPMEIAQIVQDNFGTKVFQDEKGNYIFRSAIDGRDYAIKPGFQLSDVPRAAAQITAGLIGGGGRSILGTAGREAAVQTGIETTQAGAGGTFNLSDIATAGALGAAGQKIADVAPAALQRVRNMRGGDGGGMPPSGPAGGIPSGGPAAPAMAFEGAPAAPMAPSAGMAPEAPTMGAETPRVFEAGETVTSRAGGAMGTSPESVRVMQAEGLPVPVQLTQGAATRDPEQLAFEKEQLFSELGGPLRRRAEENNLQALQNFDRFIDMTGAEAPDISATGNAVINALSKGYEAAKNRVRVAYKAADNAGETAELVSYAPIVDFINGQTATTRTTLAPILQSTLEKIRLEDPTNSGQISIRAMEDIRKTINKAAQPGTPNEVYGGSVKDIIDDVTEGVGGDLYKKARQLRIDQANKFEKRAIVSRFVSNIKNMDDRRVPADRVFQSAILNEAPENISYLKKTLKELGDDGRQAWSELQAATLRHIQEQAIKNVNISSDNLPIVSVAQLNKVVNELDKNGRLDLIFNPKMAQQVRDLRDVMQYVNTVPPGTSINNSGTARTLLALLSESGATAWMTGGIPVPVLTGIKVIRDQIKDAGIKRKINRSLLPRSERD